MATSADFISQLVMTRKVTAEPPRKPNRGRTPIYKPLIEAVVKGYPNTSVFGPFTGDDRTKAADRVRAGAQSYAYEHPEMLPEGMSLRLAVRDEDGRITLFGWLEATKDGDATHTAA